MQGTLAGQTVANRYDLLELLGKGGMGEVYRARDRELDEIVAFKVIDPKRAADPAALARFRYEVKLARRVTHRNIARTFELGHDGHVTYCTMELVDGEALTARLRRGRLAVGEAAAIGAGICEGLAAAHGAGVIHRDLKPGNVLVTTDGRPVVVDFGVAAIVRTEGFGIAGTPGYMAPEQARGEAPTPASDIYAVGVVLYEMLTGTRAFTGDHARVLAAKLELPALRLPDDGHAPRELAELVARATTRDSAHRIANATELARELARWMDTTVAIESRVTGERRALRQVIVLPPQGDTERFHVALGVHQALLDRLAKIPQLRVLPRMKVDQRADAVVELRVGRALEVRVIRATGTLQLELPLAAEDLRSIADAAAAAIASAVDEARVLVDPQLSEATDLWLQARAIMHRNIADVAPAVALLERAIALAPDDTRIIAALAVVNARSAFFRSDQDEVMLARAVELVKAALEVAPDEADVQIAAGMIQLNLGDAPVAARHFRTAIALAPYAAEAHDGLGRMLVEAGYLEAGFARLRDACAIAPDLTTSGWAIARMYALEGQWDDVTRALDELVPNRAGPRPTFELRFALWRRDTAAALELRESYFQFAHRFHGVIAEGAYAALLGGQWNDWRDTFIAAANERGNRRRRAFMCQLIAEFAGFVGDPETCQTMLLHAMNAGLFDLHWLDRCPMLDGIRDSRAFLEVHARVEKRAHAILDAMYGDPASTDLSETVTD